MSLLGHSTLSLNGHCMREVPNDWKNIIPIFKMGNKDDLVNYRLVCFTSTLAKVIDQIFQKSIPSYRMTRK